MTVHLEVVMHLLYGKLYYLPNHDQKIKALEMKPICTQNLSLLYINSSVDRYKWIWVFGLTLHLTTGYDGLLF